MIIKKHIANNTNEGISYISKNFQDEGLIISNYRVDGKNVLYFAVNEKPEFSSAKIDSIGNELNTNSDHNSESIFTSSNANDAFNQRLAVNDLNPTDLIRSTANKIAEDITPFEDKHSHNLQAADNQNLHNIINLSSESLNILKEIKSIIHHQNHTDLECRNQESKSLNYFLDLMANQFTLIQKSHESILAVQVSSQESIKYLADAIINLNTKNTINSENRDITENIKKDKIISDRKPTLGKIFFAGFIFISTSFLTPFLEKSELGYNILDSNEYFNETGYTSVYDSTIKQSIDSYETPIFLSSTLENEDITTSSPTPNENMELEFVDTFEAKNNTTSIEPKDTIFTSSEDSMAKFPDEFFN